MSLISSVGKIVHVHNSLKWSKQCSGIPSIGQHGTSQTYWDQTNEKPRKWAPKIIAGKSPTPKISKCIKLVRFERNVMLIEIIHFAHIRDTSQCRSDHVVRTTLVWKSCVWSLLAMQVEWQILNARENSVKNQSSASHTTWGGKEIGRELCQHWECCRSLKAQCHVTTDFSITHFENRVDCRMINPK